MTLEAPVLPGLTSKPSTDLPLMYIKGLPPGSPSCDHHRPFCQQHSFARLSCCSSALRAVIL